MCALGSHESPSLKEVEDISVHDLAGHRRNACLRPCTEAVGPEVVCGGERTTILSLSQLVGNLNSDSSLPAAYVMPKLTKAPNG